MHKNEWTFWLKTVNYWHSKAEEYLAMNMLEDMNRCITRADLALTNQYEGRESEIGLSRNEFIVSGRKGFGVRPTLTVQVGA